MFRKCLLFRKARRVKVRKEACNKETFETFETFDTDKIERSNYISLLLPKESREHR